MTHDAQNFLGESDLIEEVKADSADLDLFKTLLDGESEGESPTVGSILSGVIVELRRDFVVVDVGRKSEGLVPIHEFKNEQPLEVGQEVEVYLERAENERGQVVLSKDKADRQRHWEYILENCTEGSIVRGEVLRKVKGGLMIDIGVEAFLPGSQIDNQRVKNLDELVGQTFDLKILKINTERKNVVVSRRELIEAERLQKKSELLESIKEGDRCMGRVKNITEFGVFLNVGGIDGLLHKTDMSWGRFTHPSELVAPDQELEVVILGIDREKGRVALGMKQLEHNPYADLAERYPVGSHVKGQVSSLVSYGAFINIEDNIDGLIHLSEMSWVKTITDPTEVLSVGQEVEAVVLAIHTDEGRVSLGIRQLQPNPWSDIEHKYSVGMIVDVTIRRLSNFGAYVELEDGIEGLIRVADLSWVKKVAHPSEILEKDQKVKAMVLSVDPESTKITLGIKQVTKNPWDKIQQKFKVGQVVPCTVSRLRAFGAFVMLEGDIEGLIHVSELSDQPFAKVEDVVSVGQELMASITKIDPEHNKVSLSLKENPSTAQAGDSPYDNIILGSPQESGPENEEEAPNG